MKMYIDARNDGLFLLIKKALRILNEETVDVRAAFAIISYFNLF